MKKLSYVDTLRCIAILAVIFVHTGSFLYPSLPYHVNRVFDFGAKGVQLFFIASAFTLFLSFEKRITKETYPVRNFYVRRYFRIAPLYYLAIIYYLIQYAIANHDASAKIYDISTANIIAEFTFTHGFNYYWINHLVPGGWSIADEMIFYAILPFIFSKIKNLNSAFLLFTGSLFVGFWITLWLAGHPQIPEQQTWDDFVYYCFPNQLPVFCLGIIMYFVVIKSARLRDISDWSWAIFAACFLIPFALTRQIIFSPNIIASLILFSFAIIVSRGMLSFLTNPVTRFLGVRSFSMYLTHFAVIFWLEKMNAIKYTNNIWLNVALSYLVIIAVTALVSSVFYAVIEVPFQNIGSKLIDKWENYALKKRSARPSAAEERLIDQQF